MTHKVGWSVELRGRDQDLQELSRHFTEGPESVEDEGGVYILRADALDAFAMDEQTSARVRAEEIVRHMNAAAMIVEPALQPAQIGALRWTKEDGEVKQFASAVLRLTYRTGPAQEATEVSEAARILRLSGEQEQVKRVLNLLQDSEPAWPALYAAAKVAVNGLGNDVAAGLAVGVSKAQIKRLLRTPQHPDNLARLGEGDEHEARHDGSGSNPMSDPMPKLEAIDLTRRLVRAWLRTLM